MLYRIDDLTVSELLDKLAAPDFPGPASGSTAAVAAAMAAALVEMSFVVTMNKKQEQREALAAALPSIKALRKHCLSLATDDMKAYAQVVKAGKLRQESPAEFEVAMQLATNTLVAVVKNCHSILVQIERVIGTCYSKVLGDLGGSAYMAEAAAAAATQGVEVNLRLLHDPHFKAETLNSVRESYEACSEIKDRIMGVMSR